MTQGFPTLFTGETFAVYEKVLRIKTTPVQWRRTFVFIWLPFPSVQFNRFANCLNSNYPSRCFHISTRKVKSSDPLQATIVLRPRGAVPCMSKMKRIRQNWSSPQKAIHICLVFFGDFRLKGKEGFFFISFLLLNGFRFKSCGEFSSKRKQLMSSLLEFELTTFLF